MAGHVSYNNLFELQANISERILSCWARHFVRNITSVVKQNIYIYFYMETLWAGIA
jgi:hypothetical protein